MALSIGIVGLPNVGKSTLFTALTKQGGLAANYPFATIEPNVGIVPVPDARLDALAKIVKPQRIVPATVEFVDIAGLVKGANAGEGLGNQFLANIRETDAIVEVVRYFHDGDVTHVEGDVDPKRDIETISTELILADLGTLERALPRLEKEARRDKAAVTTLEVAKRLQSWLNEGKRAAKFAFGDAEERALIRDLHLLTIKPILYVANVEENDLARLCPSTSTPADGQTSSFAGALSSADNSDSLAALLLAPIDGQEPLVISAKIEADIAELATNNPAEAAEFQKSLGLSESGLSRLAQAAYKLLGLQSFFTAGPLEVRAWTIPVGTKTPQAAGVIHSDFEHGFIKAETASFSSYIEYGGEVGLRAAGKLRQEGKDYIVSDGDVMHFKFSPR
ncbi:MAG: redox-regulated ATPase YchF [Coriobacteriales bacterium]|jgi:ribosome-binding ATPase YchF (GTP1/OBG family)|nr:redox-regulated ATPase YchF [Coriobacteriales bacterium]